MDNIDTDRFYSHDRFYIQRNRRLLLFGMLTSVVVLIIWASYTELDEVTVGEGKIIPSSQIQVVQNLEGGIVEDILIREGETVEQGQLLIRLNDIKFSSEFRESEYTSQASKARQMRLEAEVKGKPLRVSKAQKKELGEFIADEIALYKTRKRSLNATLKQFEHQISKSNQDIESSKNTLDSLNRSLEIALNELELTEPAVYAGAVSEIELLRLQKDINEIESRIMSESSAIEKSKENIREIENQRKQERVKFVTGAREELNKENEKLLRLSESKVAIGDQVDRTLLKSPVAGIIKKINIKTIGGVIQPGMDIVEIVPLEDTLLLEAKINPADIAFLEPGLPAMVKISSYDFTIFGGLKAKLERISPDTIQDEKGNSFFLIYLRTERSYLGSKNDRMPIIAGMTATADIMTGKKSLIEYLLKPLRKTQELALRER